jgi:hypothetical protein
MDIMVMGRRAAAVMWHGRASETRALEEDRWERKKNMGQGRQSHELSKFRPWPPSVEPSKSNLLAVNSIY